jgi:short-subunit dehydrogenase
MKFLIYGVTKGRGDGIGRAVALQLQTRGHEVLGLCRDAEKAAKTEDIKVEAIDIGEEPGIDRLKTIIRDFDPDVIWSACGTGASSPLWSTPIPEIDDMLDANVRKNILFSLACAPSCIDGGPHLVLTGSIAGVLSDQGAAVYSGTKGFLQPFVRGQRHEYKRQGYNAKISLLLLNAVRVTGIDIVTDALEFIGRQSRSLEILVS